MEIFKGDYNATETVRKPIVKRIKCQGTCGNYFQSWQPLYNLMEQKTIQLFIVIVSLMMAAEVSINLFFLVLS